MTLRPMVTSCLTWRRPSRYICLRREEDEKGIGGVLGGVSGEGGLMGASLYFVGYLARCLFK